MYNVLATMLLIHYVTSLPIKNNVLDVRDFSSFNGLTDRVNFSYNTTKSPEPFVVDVDPDFIAATALKAELYRPSRDIALPDWTEGPPAHNMSDIQQYWVQNYSWFDVQSDINQKYTQYLTTVNAGENFTEPLNVHFAHQRSNKTDAIPLLLLHGWPSSFLEWESIIKSLACPPNDSLPSFHAVAPDLPGFGFSPAPTTPGLGSREMGQAMNNLMKQLGYEQYAIYTTDLGSFIGNWMLFDSASSIVSRLTDFFIAAPNATDLQRYSANQTSSNENTFIERSMSFQANGSGYLDIHTTRPLSVAEALTDSPLGFLAWMWELRHAVSGIYEYTPQELITDAMILYIQGTYGNIRSYKEMWREGGLNDTAYPSSDIPTGITHWPSGPAELNDPFQSVPDTWAQRTANVTFTRWHDYGGHFPAQADPQQWLDDVWAFFGDPTISGLEKLHN